MIGFHTPSFHNKIIDSAFFVYFDNTINISSVLFFIQYILVLIQIDIILFLDIVLIFMLPIWKFSKYYFSFFIGSESIMQMLNVQDMKQLVNIGASCTKVELFYYKSSPLIKRMNFKIIVRRLTEFNCSDFLDAFNYIVYQRV